MSIHNLENELAEFLGGKRITFGDTVPASATAGYPFGAIFIHKDGSSGDDAVYINTGSVTSCSFTSFASVAGANFGATGVLTDVVGESTSAAGVTVDGVLLKDSQVSTDQINEKTSTAGVTIDGVLVKDGGLTIADAANIILNTTTGTKIGTATGQKIGFFNATPVVQRSAMTTQLTSITHTAPGTPDYALQNLVQNTGFGFATADEGNTLLSVVLNLQTRVAELEAMVETLGLAAAN